MSAAPPTDPPPTDPPRRRWSVWAALGWSLVLLAIGSVPGAVLAAAPQVWDKLAHALVYGALGGLAALALRRRLSGVRLVAAALAWALAVGALDELHQQWVPRRAPSLLDLLADGVGALLAASAVAVSPLLTAARRPDTL